jgi:hypothetical protein
VSRGIAPISDMVIAVAITDKASLLVAVNHLKPIQGKEWSEI